MEYNDFSRFHRIFKENVYFLNKIDEKEIIKTYFHRFRNEIVDSNDHITKIVNEAFGITSEEMNRILDQYKDEVNEINDDALHEYLIEEFENKTIDNDGYCLKSKLIGRAVQMKRMKDMLGVIVDIDNNPRFLIVDFADEQPVKIDIDELYITGQKK